MPVPLSSLGEGRSAIIEGFTALDEMGQRLMAMGLVEGTPVKVLRFAPSGDPLEIEVLGYALSLRRSEASKVLVTPDD